MTNEDQELQTLLDAAKDDRHSIRPPDEPQPQRPPQGDYSQWQIGPNRTFRPASKTIPILSAGVYRIQYDDFGPFLARLDMMCDNIIELPESSHLRVLESIRKFWSVEDRYRKHGLIYKRGVLLWGPPGAGKTVASQLLVNELVTKHDGIVLFCENPALTVQVLRFLRSIEPKRPLIVILEDVDEIVSRYGEHEILAILDGEHQTDNVIYIATTNYPERLGGRIINRPSRFDERIKIGMPSAEARMAYLKHVCAGSDISEDMLVCWTNDTKDLSVAHLRELFVAVVCLEQPYESVLDRLKHMKVMPKPEDGFTKGTIGLNAAAERHEVWTINAPR